MSHPAMQNLSAASVRSSSPFRSEDAPPRVSSPLVKFASVSPPALQPAQLPELMAPMSLSPTNAADAMRRLSILEEEPTQTDESPRKARPETPRSATEPILPTSHNETPAITTPLQSPSLTPRQRSPYSRMHPRSTSTASAAMLSAAAPPMTRAHSSPAAPVSYSSLRSSSPLRSPGRARSPYRSSSGYEESAQLSTLSPFSLVSELVSEHIPEDSELDITPRTGRPTTTTFNLAHSNTFPRRRRPASPLHHGVGSSPRPVTPSSSSSHSLASSPLLHPTKFNESFPSDLPYMRSFSSSSVPSTPTSTRSRSPSISSLETIPDSPDAEIKAVEEDIRQRAEMDDGKKESFRRSSFDMPQPRITGVGFGGRDKRKRWSVCGAERRGDINLDTIWEV